MTKAELVSEVAIKTGFTRKDVMAVVETSMDVIKATMLGGENVYLRGFGSFINKTRRQKIARNIKQQTSIIVPEHKIPAFKASKDFSGKYIK
ncbi:MAG: integration host factor subunit beta [Paludibacteraceae bacterium]|nr:integration host factor subunit beta [Paludibacteraceae bacterium]